MQWRRHEVAGRACSRRHPLGSSTAMGAPSGAGEANRTMYGVDGFLDGRRGHPSADSTSPAAGRATRY